MSNKISNPVFIALSFILTIALYWPVLNGGPLWDDTSFWFNDPVITKDFSYVKIFTDFAWPVSVSLQKILFSLFEKNYFFYHTLNLFIHLLNAFLLFKIAEKLKLPFVRFLFLFFLLHPVNVISVSWMIQLKTLVCFLFALLSLIFFLKSKDKKLWIALSWICFYLSVFSKSASLPLPIFFLFFLYKKFSLKEFLWLIPFFVISFAGSYRVLKSPATIAGQLKVDPTLTEKIHAETSSKIKQKEAPVAAEVIQSKPVGSEWKQILSTRLHTLLGTTHYYFWQTLVPSDNVPVKGLKYSNSEITEFIHLVFLALIIAINWGTVVIAYLAAGYLFLLPFLGFLPAPYMNLTWVSDQHLYLALPFFICFWLTLIQKLKTKYSNIVQWAIVPIFCFLILKATSFYKNEINFFEASLKADPLNVPIAYNLSMAHFNLGEIDEGLVILDSFIGMANVSPEIRTNKYFPYMLLLQERLRPEKNKDQ